MPQRHNYYHLPKVRRTPLEIFLDWIGPAVLFSALGKETPTMQQGLVSVKMTPVQANGIESVGYVDGTRKLYVKFRNSQEALCFDGIPRFRFSGLMSSPRKDAYFKSFIKDSFLSSQVQLPG